MLVLDIELENVHVHELVLAEQQDFRQHAFAGQAAAVAGVRGGAGALPLLVGHLQQAQRGGARGEVAASPLDAHFAVGGPDHAAVCLELGAVGARFGKGDAQIIYIENIVIRD